MVCIIEFASRIRTDIPSWSCSQAVSKPLWHIPLLCVQWKTPDDGQRHCSKHVEFYSKNKCEKLVHLVGFIIRIYHDAARSRCTVTLTSKSVTIYGPAVATACLVSEYCKLLNHNSNLLQFRVLHFCMPGICRFHPPFTKTGCPLATLIWI